MSASQGLPIGYNKKTGMRDMVHKTQEVLSGRGKMVSILECNEDKQCVSFVRKNFLYLAQEGEYYEETPCTPQVHVSKSYDNVTQEEKFCFRVKGFFFVHRSRRLVKIGYSHTLNVRLRWKSSSISPKKTVSLA